MRHVRPLSVARPAVAADDINAIVAVLESFLGVFRELSFTLANKQFQL